MKNDLKPFYRELRRLGFKRTYRGTDVFIYEKTEGEIKFDLQLWQDARHRVSHWHHGRTLFGVMDTHPSEFTTPEGMFVAIQFERTRTANGKAKTDCFLEGVK